MLNLEDTDIFISDISIQATTKIPTLETKLYAHLRQRRWKHSNLECIYNISDSFKFVNKRRRTTNATDMLIVCAYPNLIETAVSIANRFHVSDTYVHEVFERYVKMNRIPLTDAVCIDEVFLDID